MDLSFLLIDRNQLPEVTPSSIEDVSDKLEGSDFNDELAGLVEATLEASAFLWGDVEKEGDLLTISTDRLEAEFSPRAGYLRVSLSRVTNEAAKPFWQTLSMVASNKDFLFYSEDKGELMDPSSPESYEWFYNEVKSVSPLQLLTEPIKRLFTRKKQL